MLFLISINLRLAYNVCEILKYQRRRRREKMKLQTHPEEHLSLSSCVSTQQYRLTQG